MSWVASTACSRSRGPASPRTARCCPRSSRRPAAPQCRAPFQHACRPMRLRPWCPDSVAPHRRCGSDCAGRRSDRSPLSPLSPWQLAHRKRAHRKRFLPVRGCGRRPLPTAGARAHSHRGRLDDALRVSHAPRTPAAQPTHPHLRGSNVLVCRKKLAKVLCQHKHHQSM